MPHWWWWSGSPGRGAADRLSGVGRVVPERNDPQLREVIVRPYRVVYRLRPGVVEIATVFRASRMLPELK